MNGCQEEERVQCFQSDSSPDTEDNGVIETDAFCRSAMMHFSVKPVQGFPD